MQLVHFEAHERIARLVAQRYGLTGKEEEDLVLNATVLDEVDRRKRRDFKHHGLEVRGRVETLVRGARLCFLRGDRSNAVRLLGQALHLVHDALIPSPSSDKDMHDALEREVAKLVRRKPLMVNLANRLPVLGLPHEEYARAMKDFEGKVGRAVSARGALVDALGLSWRFTHAVLGPAVLPFKLSVKPGQLAVESQLVLRVLGKLKRELKEAAEAEAVRTARGLYCGSFLLLLAPTLLCVLPLLAPIPQFLTPAILAASIGGYVAATVYAIILFLRCAQKSASAVERSAKALKEGEAYRWAAEQVGNMLPWLDWEEREIVQYLPLLRGADRVWLLLLRRKPPSATPWYNPPPGVLEGFEADERAVRAAAALLEEIDLAERDPRRYVESILSKGFFKVALTLWLPSLAALLLLQLKVTGLLPMITGLLSSAAASLLDTVESLCLELLTSNRAAATLLLLVLSLAIACLTAYVLAPEGD